MKIYFDFTRDYYPAEKDCFLVEISQGVNDKNSLLKMLSEKLKFPEYFGFNWDALSDLARDLSWIKEKKIYIIHKELPNLPSNELKIYIEILNESVEAWNKTPIRDLISLEPHSLRVFFPKESKEKILEILGEKGSATIK